MSIITNLGNFNIINDIKQEHFSEITSLEITKINVINLKFANAIKKFVNLKKVDISTVGVYKYLSKFLLFDIDICIDLYNYIHDSKNLFADDFNNKKSEFMFRIRNLKVDYSGNIIEQIQKKNKKIDNIILFYKNLSFLNIEYLRLDYFVEELFNLTTLKELELCNYNQFIMFNDGDQINRILINNININKFVIGAYNDKNTTEEFLYYYFVLEGLDLHNGWDDFVNFFIDEYSLVNIYEREMNCDNCVELFRNDRSVLLNSDEYFLELFGKYFNMRYFDFSELNVNANLKLLLFNLDQKQNYFMYTNELNNIEIKNKSDSYNLKINSLPNDTKIINIFSYKKIIFEDNLPNTLSEININHWNGHNLHEVKHPFDLKIKITKNREWN